MAPTASPRSKLRYRWSHRHPLHRAAVRIANRVLPRVPFGVKYGVTDAIRRRRLPYRLLGPTSTAIQVGAPLDTLRAGRSRAMAFARFTRPDGRVLVVEPDEDSVRAFRTTAARRGLRHAVVVRAAAWEERTRLTIQVDPGHPATNFTAGTVDYGDRELGRYREIEVDAVPIDALVDEHHLDTVDLVSITTNGAETQILNGLRGTIERDRPYICLARTEDSYAALMTSLGYELLGEDDRGFTFVARKAEL